MAASAAAEGWTDDRPNARDSTVGADLPKRQMVRLVLVSLLVLGLLPSVASASAGEVIVRYRPGVDAAERGAIRSGADVRREAALPLARTELVEPEPGVAVAAAIRELERDPDVLYAEPNAARTAFATPNDQFFGQQWGLQNTGQTILGRGGTAGDRSPLTRREPWTGSRAEPAEWPTG